MVNAIPYILLIAFLCVLAFLCENAKDDVARRNIKLCSVAAFFFFFGFRGYILSDWIIYYEYFYNCDWSYLLGWPFTQGVMEPGYTLLCLLVKSVVPDYNFFSFLCTVLDTCLLLRFFRRRVTNIPLALAIYVCFEGLLISTNFMRNSIAILIFMNCLEYMERREAAKYYAGILVAVTFHVSAALYLPLYFFFHRALNKWAYLAVFAVCNIIFVAHISMVSTMLGILGIDDSISMKVRAYTELYDKSTKISIGYLERLLTGTLVFCYYDKLRAVRQENALFVNAVLAYFVCYFGISEFEVLSKRLCALFAFGYWIVWIDLLRCFAIENNKRLYAAFIALYCVLKIGSSTKLPDFKYENILFGAQSYQERLYYHNRTFDEP